MRLEKCCEKGPTVFHPKYSLYLVGKYHMKAILSSVAKEISRWIKKGKKGVKIKFVRKINDCVKKQIIDEVSNLKVANLRC